MLLNEAKLLLIKKCYIIKQDNKIGKDCYLKKLYGRAKKKHYLK